MAFKMALQGLAAQAKIVPRVPRELRGIGSTCKLTALQIDGCALQVHMTISIVATVTECLPGAPEGRRTSGLAALLERLVDLV